MGGRVVLRARAEERRLLIEVEDECGCVFTIDVPLASEGVPASRGLAE